jgi:large subunit ribosomal protein L9
MEVILLEPIHKLGDAGKVVNVKKGYARNFLIPQGKVLFASNENKAVFEAKRAEIEKNNKVKEDAAVSEAKKIDNKFVVITRQAGEDGRLFGSVTARDIADVIVSSLKINIKRNQISLNTPIKYLGVSVEDIILHGNVTAKINVNVARSVDDAKEQEKEFLNPTKKKDEVEFVAEEVLVSQPKSDDAKAEIKESSEENL